MCYLWWNDYMHMAACELLHTCASLSKRLAASLQCNYLLPLHIRFPCLPCWLHMHRWPKLFGASL